MASVQDVARLIHTRDGSWKTPARQLVSERYIEAMEHAKSRRERWVIFGLGLDPGERADDSALERLQQRIRKHGVPNIDRSPMPFWKTGGN